VGVKTAVLATCLYAALAGKYPPVLAQRLEISAEDATQDATIAEINKHLENTDRNLASLQNADNVNALAIAEMQGLEKACFAILAVLSGTSIVLQVKWKKGSAE
jgi:hypothetical protein